MKDKIVKIREKYSLTQTQLAEKLGVSRKTIQNYEAGIFYPKRTMIARICDLFGLDMATFATSGELFLAEAQEHGGSRERLSAQELLDNTAALFAGGTMSDADKDSFMLAVQQLYWEAKEINAKYTPKKYRKK